MFRFIFSYHHKILTSIPLFVRDNPPDPTSCIRNIPGIPRDHMTMAVHHRLPGSRTDIKSNVIPGWPEFLLKYFLALINQGKQSIFLLYRHRKEIRDMPVRDEEQVPPADREAVPAGVAEIVFRDNIFSNGIAERALHSGQLQPSYPRSLI